MTVAVKNVLYTAEVVVEGGRDGHARSSDGRLDVELDTPSGARGQRWYRHQPGAAVRGGLLRVLPVGARGHRARQEPRRLRLHDHRTRRCGTGGRRGLRPRGATRARRPVAERRGCRSAHDPRAQALSLLARDRRQRPGGAGRERLDHRAGRLEQLQHGLVVVPGVDVRGGRNRRPAPAPRRRACRSSSFQTPRSPCSARELGRQLAGERERVTGPSSYWQTATGASPRPARSARTVSGVTPGWSPSNSTRVVQSSRSATSPAPIESAQPCSGAGDSVTVIPDRST